jgi:hypothetical protein
MNTLTYRWARKGSRPRATHHHPTESTLSVRCCLPRTRAGAALVLPACNSEAIQLHLDEIAAKGIVLCADLNERRVMGPLTFEKLADL